MRVRIYTIAVPLLAAVAFAQSTPTSPSQPQQSSQPSTADQTAPGSKSKNKTTGQDKTAGQGSSDRMAEMKTQMYSGTLMDASCAGSGSTSSMPATEAAGTAASKKSTSGDKQACPVSAGTTKFAMKMKDEKTVMFDDVGNQRAQEALKMHKKWTDQATAGKPVRVKVSGVLNGDKLTVVSID